MTKARDISRYGLGVGIQSASSVIAGVGVTQLNFIGAGNTFRVSGGTVDISISTPGGSQGQVQYNNSSTFAGSSNFTFDGTNVNVSGALTATAIQSTWSQVGSGLTFTTGIATNFTVSGVGTITQLVSTNVNVSGVSSVGSGITLTSTGDIRFAGIITGRGSGLSGVTTTLVASVGVQSAGAIIGAGITQLNFIGAGNTFAVRGTTVDISIAGGGGGVSTTGILSCRAIANSALIFESLDLGDSFAQGTNYAMVGPITITGTATTVTVGAGVSYVIV